METVANNGSAFVSKSLKAASTTIPDEKHLMILIKENIWGRMY